MSPRGHATPWSHLVLVSCHLVEVPPRGGVTSPPSLYKEEVRPFLKVGVHSPSLIYVPLPLVRLFVRSCARELEDLPLSRRRRAAGISV